MCRRGERPHPASLRGWFPQAQLTGWKYEVDGDRPSVIRAGEKQIAECRLNACVANGPAYGNGFGLLKPDGSCAHIENRTALFEVLERSIR